MASSATSPSPQLGSRALFPALAPKAYLAHAAISPPSLRVQQAVADYLAGAAERGVAGFGQALEQRESVRARLGRLMNAPSEDDVAFVQNTGAALSAVATSLPLAAGDRVILFRGEYPSNVHTFREAAAVAGAEVCFLDEADFLSDETRAREALERELARGAKLLAVSAVQFQTGYLMPLGWIGERCQAHGVRLCVDAVQGLGAVPLDVQASAIDYLACGGHKWLMGVDGVGVLYVKRQRVPELRPIMVGSMSYEDSMRMLMGERDQLRYDRPLLPTARLFEGGMLSSVSIAALDAATASIEDLGVSSIFNHVQDYHDQLEPCLQRLGLQSLRAAENSAARSGTLSFRLPTELDAHALIEALGERGVVASCPDGLLRLAPHWPNALAEVPTVESAVSDALAALLK